jgi:hypothetical protein
VKIPGHDEKAVSRRTAVQRAGAAAVAAGLALTASVPAANAQTGAASGIVGAWRAHVEPGPVRPQVEEIYVFFVGGVFMVLDSPIEISANPNAMKSDYIGPFAGQWLQLPNGDVRASGVQLNYNGDAVVTSVEYLEATLHYDGGTDTFAGSINWREEDANGAPLAAAPAHSINGTPIRVKI